MDITNLLYFATAADFRKWLAENGETTQELWLGFYKKGAPQSGITYAEAVDQALCYGWIDGLRKSIDQHSFANRFTPRKPKSIWSAINIKRVDELTALELMQPTGTKAYAERDKKRAELYSYEAENRELSDPYQQIFSTHETAWVFFQAQTPSYRKAASWWVMSAKREETREKRLKELIEQCKKGERLAMFLRNK